MIEKARALIKKNGLCVLATAGREGPHCSLMSFVANEDCTQIFLVTKKDTLKYRNIIASPLVSLLIDDREQKGPAGRGEVSALTLSGQALPCPDPAQKAEILARLEKRHPLLAPLARDPQAEIIKVRLTSWQLLQGVDQAQFQKIG